VALINTVLQQIVKEFNTCIEIEEDDELWIRKLRIHFEVFCVKGRRNIDVIDLSTVHRT
jgi:hypothetical protein